MAPRGIRGLPMTPSFNVDGTRTVVDPFHAPRFNLTPCCSRKPVKSIGKIHLAAMIWRVDQGLRAATALAVRSRELGAEARAGNGRHNAQSMGSGWFPVAAPGRHALREPEPVSHCVLAIHFLSLTLPRPGL